MQENKIKVLIAPIFALVIFLLLIFAAGYAYFESDTILNASNYQINLPLTTSLICTKTDCGVAITPSMMTSENVNSSTAKATNTCYLNCTCSGTPGAVCPYNVRLVELGNSYTPSSTLGTNNEFTVKVTSPAGCTAQNSSSTATQVNTIRDKVISNCAITVPASGSASANLSVEFKWYNLNIDQSSHAKKNYAYRITNDDSKYTVTLDPNGGTISQETIQVTFGETYGTLPEPTWSGHTFRGWNGKNKFNKDASAIACVKNETPCTVYGSNVLTNANLKKYFKPGVAYHISYSVYCAGLPVYTATNGNVYGFRIYSGVSGYSTVTLSNSAFLSEGEYVRVSKNFTMPATLNDTEPAWRLILYGNKYKNGSTNVFPNMYFTDIQIEEGTVETPYEPFFVTSTTKVSQDHDHTLTAIWD